MKDTPHDTIDKLFKNKPKKCIPYHNINSQADSTIISKRERSKDSNKDKTKTSLDKSKPN